MEFFKIEPLPYESTREYAYRFIKTNIMGLKILPGSPLAENDVASYLSISRTPVREAFIKLSQEDLVDIFPQKGTNVTLIDLDSVEESIFLRKIVERSVIKLACRSFPNDKLFELQSCINLQEFCLQENNYIKFYELDEQLHQTIYSGCKKARIWEAIRQLNSHYNRVRMLDLTGNHDFQKVHGQHKDIVRAIREKNAVAGIKAVASHLEIIDMKDMLKTYRQYFKQPSAF